MYVVSGMNESAATAVIILVMEARGNTSFSFFANSSFFVLRSYTKAAFAESETESNGFSLCATIAAAVAVGTAESFGEGAPSTA